MVDIHFHGKLAIQQRVLTPYRATFFDRLAASCEGGLSIFAGTPRPTEAITLGTLKTAQYMPAHNLHLLDGPFYLCWQPNIQDWLAGWDPQALILEANPRYLSTPAAIRWMKRRDRPVLGWGLGAPRSSGLLAGVRTRQRLAFIRRFDALFTYSRRGADEYAALGCPPDKIFIAHNAASPCPTHPMPSRAEGFNGRPFVLFVGRLQKRKRVELLLEACAAQPGNLQPRLVIVGDGPERAALEGMAKNIYPSAEFTGIRHGLELTPFFLEADLFVLPGTGGLAVQEAMSYGLPVIMGEGDGTNDDLVRPENGWKLSAPDTLTDTLREALSDVRRLRAMGSESYRIVSEEINLERMVEIFVSALNSLQSR